MSQLAGYLDPGMHSELEELKNQTLFVETQQQAVMAKCTNYKAAQGDTERAVTWHKNQQCSTH